MYIHRSLIGLDTLALMASFFINIIILIKRPIITNILTTRFLNIKLSLRNTYTYITRFSKKLIYLHELLKVELVNYFQGYDKEK